MTKLDFEVLEVTRQQELVEKNGKFIRTEAIGNYLCDIYQYESFYVLFFCLIESPGKPSCRCLDSSDNIEHYIDSLGRSMS